MGRSVDGKTQFKNNLLKENRVATRLSHRGRQLTSHCFKPSSLEEKKQNKTKQKESHDLTWMFVQKDMDVKPDVNSEDEKDNRMKGTVISVC